MTDRQRAIRENGIAKARSMAKNHHMTSSDREYQYAYVIAAAIIAVIALTQSLIILI